MGHVPFVVGNWKLQKNIAETKALIGELNRELSQEKDVDVGVAPVFTTLAAASEQLGDSKIQLFGQDCHWEERGAFTGEVSPSHLTEVRCTGVILGHSERRQHFSESDNRVGDKVRAALKANLSVIACVGETLEEREGGVTETRVKAQLIGALRHVNGPELSRVTVAYEPVWAIGTGRTATPDRAQDVHAAIRSHLRQRFGAIGDRVRILYGGSVKPDNAKTMLSEPDVDGALVGGAALKAADFLAIVSAARLAMAR